MKSLSWKFFRTQVGLSLVSLLPIAVNGQTTFRLFTNLDATIYIEYCYGPVRLPATNVTIPDTIGGMPVTAIGPNAFAGLNNFITNIVIPDTVVEIDADAFFGCQYLASVTIGSGITNLFNFAFANEGNGGNGGGLPPSPERVSFYFRGNAPILAWRDTNAMFHPDSTVFQSDPKGIVYYLPGTTGWSNTFGGLPTALWLPQMQAVALSSNDITNQMAFNIMWASGRTVVIESCNDLLKAAWRPVATNTLAASTSYFRDLNGTSSATGFYRARAQ